MIDLKTLHRVLRDVSVGAAPGNDYSPAMKMAYNRYRDELALARQKNPNAYLHLPGDGQDGMPGNDEHRFDYSDDQPRANDGKWTSGGGGGGGGAGGGAGAGGGGRASVHSATAEEWTAANPHGNKDVFSVAQSYLQKAKLPQLQTLTQQALSPDEGHHIADSYDAAKSDPDAPETKAAYKAFNDELAAQRAEVEKAGYKFEPWDKPGQPYANSKEMMKDVQDNKHLYYFKSTEGTTPNKLMSLDQNDTFRAVHDFFGHAMGGNQFGPKGETNAFLDHVEMFSPEARKALATETIGQNAWFNFSKANDGKPVTERRFADQKAFLLDPSLYQPLIDRSLKHDTADEEDYLACPCHHRGHMRLDYSDDQPRDESGRWVSSGGGEYKVVERLRGAGPNSVIKAAEDMNVVAKYAEKFPQIKKLPNWQNNAELLREAKAYYAAPKLGDKPYDHKLEAAKARAGLAQNEVAYRIQREGIEADRRRAFYAGEPHGPDDVGLRTAQKNMGMMENQNLEDVRKERLADPDVGTATREGLAYPNTLEGQQKFPGQPYMNAAELQQDRRWREQVDRAMNNQYGDDPEDDLRYYANNGNKYAGEKLAEVRAQNLAAAQDWAKGHPSEFGPEAEKAYLNDYEKNYGRSGDGKEAFNRNLVNRYKFEMKKEAEMKAALASREAKIAAGQIPTKPLPGELEKHNEERNKQLEDLGDKYRDLSYEDRQRAAAMLKNERAISAAQNPDLPKNQRVPYEQEQLPVSGIDRYAGDKARRAAEEELSARKNSIAGHVMEHGSMGSDEKAALIGYNRVEKAKEIAAEAADKKAKEIAYKIPMREATAEGIADMEKNSEVQSAKSFTNNNTSESYRATLPDGSFAMWKPAEGEQSDLRAGIEGGTYYLREAAAAKVAPLFGVEKMMPATVVGHDKEGREGTLQSWAVGAKPMTAMEDSGEDVVLDRHEAEKMRVYDYVAGNSDRHDNNVMVKQDEHGTYHPVMIDNGLSFPKPTSEDGQMYRLLHPYDHVPHEDGLLPETHKAIQDLDLGKMAKTLHEGGIERSAIKAAVQRGLHLKDDPEMLAVDRASSHDSHAWDDLKHDNLDAYEDRAETIVKEHAK